MLFYFHLKHGTQLSEPEALDLPDLDAARREAECFCSAVAADSGAVLGETDWEMRVTDEAGTVRLSFDFAHVSGTVNRIRAYRERAEEVFIDGASASTR